MKKRAKIVIPILVIAFLLLPNSLGQNIIEKESNIKDYKNILNDTNINTSDNLPHYLEDTILMGNSIIIVTEDGKAPNNIDPDLYDKIISYEEHDQILEGARIKYIEKYGIDPININKDSILKEFSELKYFLKNNLNEFISINSGCILDFSSEINPEINKGGPHAIDGDMDLFVFFATDQEHMVKDYRKAADSAMEGWGHFRDFGVSISTNFVYNFWDASNVGDDVLDIYYDLKNDCSAYQTQENIILIGFVRFANHNGVTYPHAFYAIVAESSFIGYDDNLIVTHELSHSIGGMGDTWWPWEHDQCYMMYFSLKLFSLLPFFFNEHWCDECYNLINNAIWQNY